MLHPGAFFSEEHRIGLKQNVTIIIRGSMSASTEKETSTRGLRRKTASGVDSHLFCALVAVEPQEVEAGSRIGIPGRNTQREKKVEIFDGKLREPAGMNTPCKAPGRPARRVPAQSGASPVFPAKVYFDGDQKDHEILLRLSGMKGRDFDRAYMKHVVENSKDDVALFERMAKEGSDPDLRSFAEQNLSTLREHLRTAQDIYSRIERQG
jgi:rubrerythrin